MKSVIAAVVFGFAGLVMGCSSSTDATESEGPMSLESLQASDVVLTNQCRRRRAAWPPCAYGEQFRISEIDWSRERREDYVVLDRPLLPGELEQYKGKLVVSYVQDAYGIDCPDDCGASPCSYEY